MSIIILLCVKLYKIAQTAPTALVMFSQFLAKYTKQIIFSFWEISLASSVKIFFQVWPWAEGINGGRGCATMYLLWCPRYKANPTNGYITSIGFVKLHHVTTYFASWQRWYSKDIDNFFTYKLFIGPRYTWGLIQFMKDNVLNFDFSF